MERENLIAYAIRYQGNWKKIANAITMQEVPIRYPYQPCITILDEKYPISLKRLQNPPWVLFYEGNLSLLEREKVTIVGSREMTAYGKAVTRLVANTLKKDFVIVSGLAKGVDGESHRCALDKGSTIGVVGHGLDTIYPRCNRDLYQVMREQHLILSEFPRGTPIQKYNFPYRNRILAGLSKAVIVTQAKKKSGTMHTVNEAIEIGTDVYTVPYPFLDESGNGCNLLLQEGANILYEMEQLEDLRKLYGVEK